MTRSSRIGKVRYAKVLAICTGCERRGWSRKARALALLVWHEYVVRAAGGTSCFASGTQPAKTQAQALVTKSSGAAPLSEARWATRSPAMPQAPWKAMLIPWSTETTLSAPLAEIVRLMMEPSSAEIMRSCAAFAQESSKRTPSATGTCTSPVGSQVPSSVASMSKTVSSPLKAMATRRRLELCLATATALEPEGNASMAS
mmetsp:Transcript_112292/g.356830  ORF Transcript_112292/g.356830 Transcript_112292/m.356830 type:complete len:201 (+) Transcript_112292:258-860(+)